MKHKIKSKNLPSGGSVEGTGVVVGVVCLGVVVVVDFTVVVNVGSASFGNILHSFSPSRKIISSIAINPNSFPPLFAINSIYDKITLFNFAIVQFSKKNSTYSVFICI